MSCAILSPTRDPTATLPTPPCTTGAGAGACPPCDSPPSPKDGNSLVANPPSPNMVRAKVPEENRKRISLACDICKHRKQRCNGQKPCESCSKKNLDCAYSPIVPRSSKRSSKNDSKNTDERPRKRRRRIKSPLQEANLTLDDTATPQVERPVKEESPSSATKKNVAHSAKSAAKEPEVPERSTGHPPWHFSEPPDQGLENPLGESTAIGSEEVAVELSQNRMLEDSTGRLQYIGDSSTLSYLQLMRTFVSASIGPTRFTEDPSRHRIVERMGELPRDILPANMLLPDRMTAEMLVESYFTNTSGLIDLFDHAAFWTQFDACYSDSASVAREFPGLLYLTFAIGLVLARPVSGSREDNVVKKLRAQPLNNADLFFESAMTRFGSLMSLVEPKMWSLRALLLMSVYSLVSSKRTDAYSWHGMAVRSGFALGLQREGDATTNLFSDEERLVRLKVWKSLFVLDRFLSASLGRPVSISEEDCSDDAIHIKDTDPGTAETAERESAYGSAALNASFRIYRIIGLTLKKVYTTTNVSPSLAEEISRQSKDCHWRLPPSLHWQHLMQTSLPAALRMAVLHVNLLCCYSVILLARRCFLYQLCCLLQQRGARLREHPMYGPKMARFSETCVIAAYHAMHLVQVAHESSLMPSHDPFIINCLFAALLIVLSSEYGPVYHNESFSRTAHNGIAIMRSFADDGDAQAKRLMYILEALIVDVERRKQGSPEFYANPEPKITYIPNPKDDPIDCFFASHEPTPPSKGTLGRTGSFDAHHRQQQQAGIPPPALARRRSSFVSPTAAAYQMGPDLSIHSPTHPRTTFRDGAPPNGVTRTLTGTTISSILPHGIHGSMADRPNTIQAGNPVGADVDMDLTGLMHPPGTRPLPLTTPGTGAPPGGAPLMVPASPRVAGSVLGGTTAGYGPFGGIEPRPLRPAGSPDSHHFAPGVGHELGRFYSTDFF